MSLILEALKKLEREKQASGDGLVVLGPTAWPAHQRRSRWGARLLGAGLLAALLLAGFGWWRRPAAPPGSAPRAAQVRETSTPAAPTTIDAASEPLPARTARVVRTPARPAPATRTDRPVPTHHVAPDTISERASSPAATTANQGSAPPSRPATKTPPKAADQADTPLVLQAISERDGQPVAILNGRLVRAGDAFDGVHIIRIGPTEVEVEVDDQRRILSF